MCELTLRDQFAMAFPFKLLKYYDNKNLATEAKLYLVDLGLMSEDEEYDAKIHYPIFIAIAQYRYADAMMRAREAKSPLKSKNMPNHDDGMYFQPEPYDESQDY